MDDSAQSTAWERTSILGSVRRLLAYARPYLPLLAVALVFTLVFAGARYGRAYLLKPLLDDVVLPAMAAEKGTGERWASELFSSATLIPEQRKQDETPAPSALQSAEAQGALRRAWGRQNAPQPPLPPGQRYGAAYRRTGRACQSALVRCRQSRHGPLRAPCLQWRCDRVLPHG